jgi:hypothetical protein
VDGVCGLTTDSNGNPFSISNMVPGDTASGSINIHNNGPTAFKYVTVTLSSPSSSPLDKDIWVNSSPLGISNWGLSGAEGHGAWTYSQRIGSGANANIPFSFSMVEIDNNFNVSTADVNNTDPVQGATQTVTFTVKAYQRDGTTRTYNDSVDL